MKKNTTSLTKTRRGAEFGMGRRTLRVSDKRKERSRKACRGKI